MMCHWNSDGAAPCILYNVGKLTKTWLGRSLPTMTKTNPSILNASMAVYQQHNNTLVLRAYGASGHSNRI